VTKGRFGGPGGSLGLLISDYLESNLHFYIESDRQKQSIFDLVCNLG